MFEGRAIFETCGEEKKKSETRQETVSKTRRKRYDLQSLFQDYIAGQDTVRSIPSCSDATVPVCTDRNFNCTFAISPGDDQSGRNLSDDRSLHGDSALRRKELGKLGIEQ